MPKAKVTLLHSYREGGSLPVAIRPVDTGVLVEIEQILENVCYRDWEWYLIVNGDMGQLAATFIVADSSTGQPVRLVSYGASIPLDRQSYSVGMTVERMVIEVAWRAVQDFALHEAAEWFRYKGALIHDPHKEERARAVKPADLTGGQCPS